MKKSLWIIVTLIMTLALAACGQTAEPVDSNTNNEQHSAKMNESKNSDLTLEEVFKKSTEANNKIKSFATNMDMKQVMNAAGEELLINSTIDMKIVVDPLTLYQKMNMTMDLGEELGEQAQEVEAYLTEDGFFMYEPTQDMWMKLPTELTDQILQLQNGQTNPADQLDQFKEFVDDFEFKQNDNEFILTLNAEGDKFNDFIKKSALNALPEEMPLGEEVLDSMTFNNVKYELFIDKESFLMSKLTINMDIDTTIEDETMNMKQEVNATYSNYNKVETIEVPQEVMDHAQELDLSDIE